MTCTVLSHDAFDTESGGLAKDLQDELMVHARLVADFGPLPGRPIVDTLKGSRYANMMELRFSRREEVRRVAFAFDPLRRVEARAMKLTSLRALSS